MMKPRSTALIAVASLGLAVGGRVEEQVANGLQALLESDAALAEPVAGSDYRVNAQEVAIDEKCIEILARRQPAASDLRLVVAIIKTITNLERIGDHASNICEYVIFLVRGKDVRHVNYRDMKKRLKE